MRSLVFTLVLLTGCGATSGDDGQDHTVLVFAAASLADVFAEVEAAFEAAHPGVDVQVNTAGSATLREQILEGAPADVFAPADPAAMDPVVAAGHTVSAPVELARNTMQIGVPADDPAGVRGLEDLARAELLVGLCTVSVPCGALARQLLANAGVEPAVDTEEPDVGSLRTKLAVGELDVGIVYRTDVIADDRLRGVDIADAANVVATYPIAALRPGVARDFVAFATGPEGRRILVEHGFGTP
ncbi:MAG: molybdate ABC transporter substrate-binding protein [Acidimicrobiia bacterium]|nr:molybdate ABC transporter substrate-binding protein [Acidimicrobiia bacterium]